MTKKQMKFCLKVKEAILAKPETVLMDYFITDLSKENRELLVEEYNLSKKFKCDTVGCIAGQACMLKDKGASDDSLNYVIENRAAELMGLNPEEAEMLFFFPFHGNHKDMEHPYQPEAAAIRELKPGTRKYVKVIARAIDKAIKRNYKPRA